jgi:uncharacterized coiled-coil protein SlyX
MTLFQDNEISRLREQVTQLGSEVATLQDLVSSLEERLAALESDPHMEVLKDAFVEGAEDGMT